MCFRFLFEYLDKNFWIFRATQMAALLGNQVAVIAISFYVLNHGGSASKISYIFVPAIIVGLLLSLVLGPIADKHDRKYFIIIGSFFKSITWFAIAIFIFINKISILGLSCLYILNGIGMAIIMAGSSGFLPEIVREKHLQKAFQVATGADSITNILGGAFAGVLVSVLSVPLSLLVNFVIFLISGFATIFIAPFKTGDSLLLEKSSHGSIVHIIKEWPNHFLEGIRFITKFPSLMILALALICIQFIIAPLQIALPVFVKTHLAASPGFFGFLMSAEGVGAVISSAISGRLSGLLNKETIIMLGFVITAIGILSFSLNIDKFYYLLGLAVAGVGINLSSIVINTTLMKNISGDYRSRFFTFLFFVENSMIPISLILAGYLIDWFGIERFFAVVGCMLLSVSILFTYNRAFKFLGEAA